jgi:hypothetical protein
MIRNSIPLLALLAALSLPLSAQLAPGKSVRYDSRSFLIDGRPVLIYSGAFHYFRCPKPLWRDRLRKIKEAHFNTVETYVAWNWHERRQGQVDLRDFDDFLKLAERMGFYVIARPGPYICAEWDAGGFPTWLPGRTSSLRDSSADSVRWSRYWYDRVLPVIRRHQLGHGGTVIMVQLENEYDFFPGASESEKKEYVRSLYRIAKDDGIDVPLITCWTRPVRDRRDPDMRNIMDSDNFYPRWDVKSTVGQLAQLGRQQPDAPKMVTELQGGWFSQFGGKLSSEQEGISAEQENALIKTVWSAGATSTNHYVLFGGTNFGYWAGKGDTTTYDYAAPIREPGGLWDKYYAVRAAGKFVQIFGETLARAVPMESGPTTDMEGVAVVERVNGTTGFLFVRNDTEQEKTGLVTAIDPTSGRQFDIGVHLEPRGAKVLPINARLANSVLQRTNAEVAGVYRVGNKPLIVLAGDPGETLQATFGTGLSLGSGVSATLPSDPLANPDQMVTAANGSLVLFTTAARASRISEVKTDRNSEWPVSGGFYRLADSGATDDRLTFSAELTAGRYDVSIPLPRRATRIRVNGADVAFQMGQDGLARFQVDPGRPDIPQARMGPVKQTREMWGGGSGWKPITLQPLDELGVLDNGYTRYRTLFTWHGEKELVLQQFATDPILVAINGVAVPGEPDSRGTVRIDLTKCAKQGINRVEALYENAGRPNFGGKEVWERKGLKSASLLIEADTGASLEKWRFRKSSAPGASPAEAAASFDDSDWKAVGIGTLDELNNYHGWAWYRTTLNVSPADLSPGRTMLRFEGVDDNCIVYINGVRVGENRGWDQPFEIDVKRLAQAGPNTLAVAVQNNNGAGGIYKPVTLGSAQIGEPLKGWEMADRLQGQLKGWVRSSVRGPAWPRVSLPDRRTDRSNTVRWYRTSFRLPTAESSKFRGPWKLAIEAGGEALIYVNGYPVGRYSDRGPQSEFYLPEPWLHTGSEPNIVAIAVRDGKQPAALRSIGVQPYGEYATRKMAVSVEF